MTPVGLLGCKTSLFIFSGTATKRCISGVEWPRCKIGETEDVKEGARDA